MSVVKSIETVSLSIEVQNGLDKAGDPTFTKKSFSGVRPDVDPGNAYAVAEAIKGVMAGNTRATMLNETSNLVEQ
jgi:hypothetical protein